MSPWVSVALTVAIFLVGLAIQGAVLGFFLGKMRQAQAGQAELFAAHLAASRDLADAHQKAQEALMGTFRTFLETTVSGLLGRLAAADEFQQASAADRAAINARLQVVEKNTDSMPGMRDTLVAATTRIEQLQSQTKEEVAALKRASEGLQRQITTLAGRVGGTSVIELSDRAKP